MRPLACHLAHFMLLWLVVTVSFGQNDRPAPARPLPNPIPAAPAFDPRVYSPVCSTEKVNGNCVFNIDRRYPITLPTFQLRRGSHVTVYVFHPFAFEALTLDPGMAQAFQGTDQLAAFVTAATAEGKGASFGLLTSSVSTDIANTANFMGLMEGARSQLPKGPPSEAALADEILRQLTMLNKMLTDAIDPVPQYFAETKDIYSSVREIESAQPRPLGRKDPPWPNPWDNYSAWRDSRTQEINQQGNDTTRILDRLPGPCQKDGDPVPAIGPWLPSKRLCSGRAGFQDSDNPFAISTKYDALYKSLLANLQRLPAGSPDPETYRKIQALKTQLDARHSRVSEAIPLAIELLPFFIGKISPDMQTLLANINMVRAEPESPTLLGVIPPPPHSKTPTPEEKVLAPYKALAPTITYTVNAQNEIANSLLSLPAASQKQSIATITVLWASPRFELSTGAFFSWLPNRTFANITDTTVTGGVPAPVDIRIAMTKTVPPLVIPFVAANYRLGNEFTWMGGRRGAVYATAGVALNPYNTQVEYAGGLSFSWRYLMFGPLFHLGHGTHLTQGQQDGQIWCQYGNGATATSTPPVCSGPPAPSTKMYWRGAFAFELGVRIPTTFSATNH